MDKEQLITALKKRMGRLSPYNLVYAVLPVSYSFVSLADEIASEIDAEYISVMELLVERFGKVWDRLIEREQQDELSIVAKELQELIQKMIRNSKKPVVIADVEVLSIMPEFDLTSLLYLDSNMKLISVFIRGELTGSSIRLLGNLPEYDVRQCTVIKFNSM